MELNSNLLFTDAFDEENFNSTNARGTYNPMQFVIRLREDIHVALKEDDLSPNKIQAFSTFLHENIHWWQHVGSNFGFILSLSYPALSHAVHGDLKTLIERNERYKPIIKYDNHYFKTHKKLDNYEVNRILNNYHDLLYAKWFAYDNKNIHKIVKDRRFFLSVGHCYRILWTTSVHTLAHCLDKEYQFLPNVTKWLEEFKKLEQNKVDGFYIDSAIGIAPLGIKAIYEGQARFNQLQYLTIASENTLKYDDFKKSGMLNGIYVEAFDLFLKITKINVPADFNNATIGLFLLVCDIAINPTEGFPHDIFHFESFIYSNDPGIRFIMLCQAISKDKTAWENCIQDYSAEEYIKNSEKLCDLIFCLSPYFGIEAVNKWIETESSIKELMEEEKKMDFNSNNLPIRLFFSKYLKMQQDKLKYPNVFCWIGKSMTSECCSEIELEKVVELFDKHRALYIDDIDKEIHPMHFDEFPSENIEKSFNAFYTYNTSYDMIHKWIKQEGDFTYDYEWLTPKYTKEETTKWIRENFKDMFTIYPEDITII